MNDLQILRQSWLKYKNKRGKKAQKLKTTIEASIYFAKLIKRINTADNGAS